MVQRIKERILAGGRLSREEALMLFDAPLEELSQAAQDVREQVFSNAFNFCTILSVKSGRCSEDCGFCAQSAHHQTGIPTQELLSTEGILEDAKRVEAQGITRYSLVSSGKRVSDEDLASLISSIKTLRQETALEVCVSFGLLEEAQFLALKDAGVTRVHNNLESSRSMFKNLCHTHSFDEKISSLRAAKRVGLEVCSGGIVGLGETREDRLDMAFTLRELGIKSVPINMLNPIPGTPLGEQPLLSEDELQRTVAIFRLILPEAWIRLAGGRGLLEDRGEACFKAGANAAITGDMLTTAGVSVQEDRHLIEGLGFHE